MRIKFLKTVAFNNRIYEKGSIFNVKEVPNYEGLIKGKLCTKLQAKGAGT